MTFARRPIGIAEQKAELGPFQPRGFTRRKDDLFGCCSEFASTPSPSRHPIFHVRVPPAFLCGAPYRCAVFSGHAGGMGTECWRAEAARTGPKAARYRAGRHRKRAKEEDRRVCR